MHLLVAHSMPRLARRGNTAICPRVFPKHIRHRSNCGVPLSTAEFADLVTGIVFGLTPSFLRIPFQRHRSAITCVGTINARFAWRFDRTPVQMHAKTALDFNRLRDFPEPLHFPISHLPCSKSSQARLKLREIFDHDIGSPSRALS